ncbi:MAG TPA: EamA family transporter [Trueperaceae bacterium]|nr:EamA family transporter [Trueperaceae bacterium]
MLVLLAAVLWALLGVFSHRLLAAGVPAIEIAFWRAALAAPLFIAHAAARRSLRVATRDLPAFVGFALVGVTLFYASLNIAIDAGGVSLAFVLLYTAPAFVAVLAASLLGERLTRAKALLVTVSIVGVALVSTAGGVGVTPTPAAVAWGLTAGLSYASYYLFGKWALRRYRPVTIFAVVMPVGALGLLPLVGFEVIRMSSSSVWLDVGLMGVLSTYLAYYVYYSGLRTVEATRAVLVATVEPLLAAALAALLFGERLGPSGIVGGVLVLLAATLASTRRAARSTGVVVS